MLRKLSAFVFAFAVVVTGQNRPTFRSDVSQVHVGAEVLSKDGRIVTGLTKSDFRVFDEGQEQPVASLAAEEQPLDIILLFDISGSMRSKVKKVASAAHQALGELRRGDRVSLMTFNDSARLISSFTDDLDSVERDIQQVLRIRFGGRTYMMKAVAAAAHNFLRESRTHRGVRS